MDTKFALALISVILVASLAANAYFYIQQNSFSTDNALLHNQVTALQGQLATAQQQANNLQNEKENVNNQMALLESQETHLKNQIANLQNQVSWLQNENDNFQRENANLKSQLYYPREPQLVTRLGVSDVLYNPRYTGNSLIPRLYIQGEVWNAGDKTAYNCRLHVTIYQNNVAINDTTIELGTIEPWSFVSVSRNIYYEGTRLTNWTITPEFG